MYPFDMSTFNQLNRIIIDF